jgi:hypothetical protein
MIAFLALVLALPFSNEGVAAIGHSPSAPPACRADELTVRTDAGDGEFSGMSHAGTRLVVRNTGRAPCLLPGLPTVVFLDARGAEQPSVRQAPPGMHPGPAVLPVRLAPGAEAMTTLRWVSGEVYDRSRCFTAARVRVRFGASTVIEGPMQAHVCTQGDAPAKVEQPPMTSRQ